ncbi:MAG: PQQ-binding-like beta-propeller repeat protein [Candidatus Bathyarchaeales archaeon]
MISLLCFLIATLPIVGADETVEIWKREFRINIVGLAVADSKLFVTTNAADLYCLDEKDGKTL